MFGASKISESPNSQKTGLQMDKYSSKFNDISGISGRFTSPKITSTPVRLDICATPPRPHLLGPRRYSLSDIATPPRINKRDSINRSSFQQNVSGPLLASTKFNVNVSTYEETKSPGLARRIVQYSQESEREKERHRPPTHQAKYGSPGLFPIVHLFKKSPPSLEQRPKRVKVRISSPGYSRHQSDEYKLKLLEGIVKPRIVNNFGHGYQHHSAEASTSTRSVLDALKEISRKRIHASEEYDLNEDSGKRQRTDFINGIDSNKRNRDEGSPVMDSPTSPNKPISKRACMYDEYAASCSSTVHSVKNSDLFGSKRKSISTSTLTENPKETKQVKLINAETQTVTEEKDTPTEEPKTSTEEPQEHTPKDDDNTQKKRESPLKVFDDAPLERIRKNRLAALMGSLTGKDPVLTPKPTFSSILNGTVEKPVAPSTQNVTNEPDKAEKPLVPILVTNKSPSKSEKHVHFNIPEKTDSESSSTLFNTVPTLNTNSLKPVSVSKESDKDVAASTPAPPSSPVSLKPPEPTLAFGIGSRSSLPSADFTTSISFSVASSSPIPQFSFGSPSQQTSATVSVINTPSMASSPKPGGFKFDLAPTKPEKGSVTVTTSALATITPPKTVESGFAFGKNTSVESSSETTTTQSSVVAAAGTSTGLTFGTSTSTSSSGPVSSSSALPFTFGGFNSESNSKPNVGIASVMSKSEMAVTTTPSTLSFGKVTTTSSISGTSFATTTTQANKASTFSFGAVKSISSATTTAAATTTSTFSFTTPKPVVTTAASSNVTNTGFGALSSNSGAPANVFGNSSGGFGTTPPNFGNSTAQSGFGAPNPTSGFGAATTTTSGFGSVINTTTVFTAPSTTANVFGTATTTSSGFGSSTQPASFGGATQPAGFGGTTQPAGFGGATQPAGFGGSPLPSSFGAPSQPTSFGAATQASTFGTSTQASNFGTSTGFGTKTSTAPTFGSSNNVSGFGAFKTPSTTSGGFGTSSIFSGNKAVPTFSTPVTTTAASFGNPSPFGNSTVSGFGQNNVSSPFAPTTTTASFGTSNTFNTTTTPSSVFGGSGGFGAPANSSANIFGGTVTTQASGFGTSNSIFSTTSSVGPFGTATTTNTAAFGASTTPSFAFSAKTGTPSTNGFGSNAASSGFGSATAPTFGSKANAFGAGNTSFGNSSSFGSSGTSSSFGAATTQPSGFGMTSGGFGSQTPAFGAENKPSFGATTAPSFGTTTATPVFGSTAPSASFGTPNANAPAFGAASNSTGFAKPPTNTFGAAAPNNFGSSPGGFGASQTAAGPFGNSATAGTSSNSSAVFNFGSGATAKPGVFSFGNASASGDTAKPSFNFTGGSGAPAFGASSTFGGAAAPSFGAAGGPQFGAQPNAAAPGMFNIGSGSPSTRNRTMIRAKRRT